MGDYTLIELPSGERQFVRDASEYGDDVTIVAEGVDLQTDPDAELIEGTWVVPLEVQQERAWAAVKATREGLETGTAPTPIGRVQIDEPSKAKIMGLLSMARLAEEAGTTFSEEFTIANNSVVTLDNVKVRQLAMASAQYVSAVYAHARGLREQIFAADAQSLAAIDLDAGWPT
jgi:hypothetical protein